MEITKNEMSKILKIADKVMALSNDYGLPSRTKLDIIMDFENVIRNNTKLDLDLLLDKEHEGTLLHDYIGIYNNLNRENGKLENNFLPRSAIN